MSSIDPLKQRLLVFGASGDLMKRYLAPALVELEHRGLLSRQLTIVGSSREEWTPEEFRSRIEKALEEHEQSQGEKLPEPAVRAVLDRLDYCVGDITAAGSMNKVLSQGEGPAVIYLAVPPSIAEAAVKALCESGVPKDSHLVLEKPFGQDLESASRLNKILQGNFDEDNVFRIDHFLGLRTVRNILALRFANRVLEGLFSAEHVERVEIIWDETLALEGRAGYFDSAGALKDMLQNHLLQVLAFLTMEAPSSLKATDVQKRKLELLKAVRKLSPQEAAKSSIRARYSRGEINGKQIPAYAEEEGVDAAKQRETFAQFTLHIDNPRWSGVPFVLRSGKALKENRQEAVVVLKPAAGVGLFEWPHHNRLKIKLLPDGLVLTLNTIADDMQRPLCVTELDGSLPVEPLSPYARVLQSVLRGTNVTAIGAAEAEESWRIVEPFLRAWQENLSPLLEYGAGSSGPNGESNVPA